MEEMDMKETNDILLAILLKLEAQEERATAEKEDVLQMAYPNTGAKATLAAGTTTLDFGAGTVETPAGVVSQMSTNLRKHNYRFLQSCSMTVSVDSIIQFDNEDKFPLDAHHEYEGTNQEFERVKITCTAATEFFMVVSTA